MRPYHKTKNRSATQTAFRPPRKCYYGQFLHTTKNRHSISQSIPQNPSPRQYISYLYSVQQLRARKGGARGGKAGFANSECFPPRLTSALKSEKHYYIKNNFPTLLSQKRNILLRRKQLLKKSIQQHRIYKSYKSKSKEEPAACIKWLHFYINISHIQRKDRNNSDSNCSRKMHKRQQKRISAKCP